MKSGEIIEEGPTAEVFAAPKTAFTRLLIDSIRCRIPTAGWTQGAGLSMIGIARGG